MQTLVAASHEHLPTHKYLTLKLFHPSVFFSVYFIIHRCSCFSLFLYALKRNTTSISGCYLNTDVTTGLFTIAKIWKQPMCSSVETQLRARVVVEHFHWPCYQFPGSQKER